ALSTVVSGVFTDMPQTISCTYERVMGAEVKVRYVDEAGIEIAESEVLTGYIGETYTSMPKEIIGYKFNMLTDDSATEVGTFTDTAQMVTYQYAKVERTHNGNEDNTKNDTPKTDDEKNE